jgi:predicted enzyme related to lactoylglutathione lyase
LEDTYISGLRLPDSDAEPVIQTEQNEREAYLLVETVEKAVVRIVEAGGKTLVDPFDIRIG